MPPRRRFGQHFLEAVWVRKLADVIDPAPDDTFVEIGPGRGALTLALAARGAHVVAVEIDCDLALTLSCEAPPTVQIVTGDFLDVDFGELERLAQKLRATHRPGAGTDGRKLRVVGNLPYNVASPILLRLLRLANGGARLGDATLMLQREVADRVVAPAGSRAYGPLAIMTRLHADAERVLTLPPGAFRPVPKVWSALVRLQFRRPAVPLRDPELFEALVRAIFGQRRKTVLNALRPFSSAMGVSPGRALAGAGLDGRRRPDQLTLAELAELAEVLAAARVPAVL